MATIVFMVNTFYIDKLKETYYVKHYLNTKHIFFLTNNIFEHRV